MENQKNQKTQPELFPKVVSSQKSSLRPLQLSGNLSISCATNKGENLSLFIYLTPPQSTHPIANTS